MESRRVHLLRLPYFILPVQNSIMSFSHHIQLILRPPHYPWVPVSYPWFVWHIDLIYTLPALLKYGFVNLMLNFWILLFPINVRIILEISIFLIPFQVSRLKVRLFAEELLLMGFLKSHIFVVILVGELLWSVRLWRERFVMKILLFQLFLLDEISKVDHLARTVLIPLLPPLLFQELKVLPLIKIGGHRRAPWEEPVVVSLPKVLLVRLFRRRLVSLSPLFGNTLALWVPPSMGLRPALFRSFGSYPSLLRDHNRVFRDWG